MNTGTKRTMRKSTKTTIRHLEIQKEPRGTPHTIWKCVKKQKSDIQKAEVKVKLVTDTYMLQYHQDKLSHINGKCYTVPYIMWCSYRFLLNFKVSDSCFR
jgi:hypothetical protein